MLNTDKNNMDALWMPFSSNRDFKQSPRVIKSASGHYYTSDKGDEIYDIFSGLWTTGVGHCHPKIVEAVQKQVAELDYSIAFQVANDKCVELAERVTDFAPEEFKHCFFTNSGSEAVDTALKIALGYHQVKNNENRTKLIGRERGYHGAGFGGISVGGIEANRKMFASNLIPNVDHLSTTINIEKNAFTKGLPEWGSHLAEELNDFAVLSDGPNIAAVIVEPIAGSTGIIPPPLNYLKKLRDICDKHGILLIFDEVITGFGRVGASFAAERFGVIPDIITTAKGLTNGVIPMGGVLVQDYIYDAFMTGPDYMVEFFHGYTYSGHPVAAAAGLATMDVYKDEDIFQQALDLESKFGDLLHSFKGHEKVIDVRNFGLMGAIELAPRIDKPGIRGYEVHKHCFHNEKIAVRNGMDIIQFAPFLNSNIDELTRAFEGIRRALDAIN